MEKGMCVIRLPRQQPQCALCTRAGLGALKYKWGALKYKSSRSRQTLILAPSLSLFFKLMSWSRSTRMFLVKAPNELQVKGVCFLVKWMAEVVG